MDPKLSQAGDLGWGNPPTKSRDTLIMWSRDKSKTLNLHFHNTYKSQTKKVGDLGWGNPTHQITWHIDHVVMRQIKNVISPRS